MRSSFKMIFENIITINFLRNCVTVGGGYCSVAECGARPHWAGTHAVFTQPGVSDKEMTRLVAVGPFNSAELSLKAAIICDRSPFSFYHSVDLSQRAGQAPCAAGVSIQPQFTPVIASLSVGPGCLLHQRRHIISAGGLPKLDFTRLQGRGLKIQGFIRSLIQRCYCVITLIDATRWRDCNF